MSTYTHPFHIVNQSSWPLTGALATFMSMSELILWFHQYNNTLLSISTLALILTMYQWDEM